MPWSDTRKRRGNADRRRIMGNLFNTYGDFADSWGTPTCSTFFHEAQEIVGRESSTPPASASGFYTHTRARQRTPTLRLD